MEPNSAPAAGPAESESDKMVPERAEPENVSPGTVERRAGPADRRAGAQDRRDPERAAEDIAPRRHPDVADRRKR